MIARGGKWLVGVAVAAWVGGAPAAEALRLKPADGPGESPTYRFDVAGSENYFVVLGRSVTTSGQALFVEHNYRLRHPSEDMDLIVNEDRERELAEAISGGHFRLETAEGRRCEATNVRFVKFQEMPRGDDFQAQILEWRFDGEFAGDLTLVVKLKGDKVAEVPFGPAARDYYRRATVTATPGLNFRVDSSTNYAVTRVLPPGETIYLSGFRSYGYEGENYERRVVFYEAWSGVQEGWVAYQVEGEAETFFDIGGFAAF